MLVFDFGPAHISDSENRADAGGRRAQRPRAGAQLAHHLIVKGIHHTRILLRTQLQHKKIRSQSLLASLAQSQRGWIGRKTEPL